MTEISVDPARERAELQTYLGPAYDEGRLVRYEEQVEADLERAGSEAELYRTSEGYLYDLTAFAMTQTKLPYLRALASLVPEGARLLDYGCGLGSDGLALLEAGYRVDFADFDNPSTRYLRWRLERRGLQGAIFDLDRAAPPAGYDLAFAFDVAEHVEDPFALLATLAGAARLVLVNLLEPVPDDVAVHHDLPVAGLLAHAAKRGPALYELHHERSHLVAFGADRGRLAARWRMARARRALRARAGGRRGARPAGAA